MAGKSLKASIIIGGSVSASLRSALSSTKSGLKGIGDEIARVEAKRRVLGQGMESFGRVGAKVADTMRRDYDAQTNAVNRLRAAQSRLLAVQARIEANAARRQVIGGQLRGAVGTFGAVAAAVVLPSRQAAEFNRQNQLIGNTANMTRTEVAALGQTVLAVSRDTNQSAADVQRGIGFLIAAGLDAKRAQASIRTIGRTTTASGADIEDLAKASFTLIDALKVRPDGLQGALDILAVAGKQGNVELRDMAKTLPVLGSAFAAMKMQGVEATATIGAALQIARKGAGDADEAANNLRNFMAKVLAPDTLKKAKKKFGLDLYAIIQDTQRKGGNPFEAAMQAIMRATAGDQKKIGELFQDMQVQNFIRPMIQNWNEYTRIKNDALNSSGGNTDRDFAKVMGTAAEKMRSLKNSAQRAGITFGTIMAPSIGSAADKLGSLLDRASAFAEKNPGMVKGIVGAAVALSGLRVVTLGVAYAWTAVAGPVLRVASLIERFRAAGAIAEAGGKVGRLAGMFLRVGSVVRTVGTAIAAIGGGPIALVVGALTVGALIVRKYWQPIGAFLGGMFRGIAEGARPAMQAIGSALAPLKPAWDVVAGAVGAVWRWVVRLLEPVNMTSAQLKAAGNAGASFGRVVGVVLGGVVRALVTPIRMFVALGQAIGSAAGFLVVRFGGAWDKVKSIIGSAVDWILRRVQPVLSLASSVGGMFGFRIGGQVAHAGPRAAGMPAPTRGRPAPPMAVASRGAPGSYTVNNSPTFNITQQPGESGEALAQRIAPHLRRMNATNARGSLIDAAA